MDTQILYKSDGNYYIEEIIPGEYSDRGEFITHYQASETARRIRKMRSLSARKTVQPS